MPPPRRVVLAEYDRERGVASRAVTGYIDNAPEPQDVATTASTCGDWSMRMLHADSEHRPHPGGGAHSGVVCGSKASRAPPSRGRLHGVVG
ncbi:hypothetical protein FHY19_003443 [Xanthomonas arboricola]|nr:hypothetical protein [Xanthomonas sp. 4461]